MNIDLYGFIYLYGRVRKFTNLERICGYCGERKTSLGHKTRGEKTWEYENWTRWKGIIACSRCYKTRYDAARPRRVKRQKLDGLEKVCKICGSYTTRVAGTLRCAPYPRWYTFEDGMICYKCEMRRLYLERKARKGPPKEKIYNTESLIESIRLSFLYQKWRVDTATRDNFTCSDCGVVPKPFHVHHVKPLAQIIQENGLRTPGDAAKCKELWDISNGMTLCTSCHSKREHRKIV